MSKCCIAKPYTALRDLARRVAKLETDGVPSGGTTVQPETPSQPSQPSQTVVNNYNTYVMTARNLLDNTNFKNPINQRGVSETISTPGYFLDRWKLESGTVYLSPDGLMLNGVMIQILEHAPLGPVTPCASSGTVVYDEVNHTIRITGSNELIEWAALYDGEYTAENMPQYQPKPFTTEMLECQRYFYKPTVQYCFTHYANDGGKSHYAGSHTFPIQMRTTPTITITYAGAAKVPSGVNTLSDYNVFTVRPDGINGANMKYYSEVTTGCPLYLEIEASADL